MPFRTFVGTETALIVYLWSLLTSGLKYVSETKYLKYQQNALIEIAVLECERTNIF